jgi:hypothetical protein
MPNRVFVWHDFLITTQYLPSSLQAFRRNVSQTRSRGRSNDRTEKLNIVSCWKVPNFTTDARLVCDAEYCQAASSWCCISVPRDSREARGLFQIYRNDLNRRVDIQKQTEKPLQLLKILKLIFLWKPHISTSRLYSESYKKVNLSLSPVLWRIGWAET